MANPDWTDPSDSECEGVVQARSRSVTPHRVEAPSYPVSIFIAGEYDRTLQLCQDYCDHYGLCVTVTKTHYVYTGGDEPGVVIGLINYPRFPSTPEAIFARAEELAISLLDHLRFPPQQSCTIQAPDRTLWISFREQGAQAIEARRAATTGAVEDESAVPQGCANTSSAPAHYGQAPTAQVIGDSLCGKADHE